MSASFENSVTKENLMRAFAGESQARNRYMFAAAQARREKLPVIEAVFQFTAKQEEAHAKIFYDHLKMVAGQTITVDGGYPVDIADDVSKLLRMAQHNEYEEADDVYQAFGNTAKEEGFMSIANSFFQIAEIEKVHGDRFGRFADLIEQGALFASPHEMTWICLKCGHVYRGTEAPPVCPVCKHEQGYFFNTQLGNLIPVTSLVP